MHRRIRPRVASCPSRAPLLSPWLSRSRCRSPPTPTKSHRHPCPPTFRCRRGTRRSSWVTPSAPRTTSACPQALASSSYSSRRRPPCSTTTTSKSPPTSSAPTRLRNKARFAPRGSTRGTRAPSGARWDPPGRSSSDPAFVAQGAIAWLLLTVAGVQDGPTGGDTLTATTFVQRLNTSGGARTVDGLCLVGRRRQSGVCALHGRLLLQGPLRTTRRRQQKLSERAAAWMRRALEARGASAS